MTDNPKKQLTITLSAPLFDRLKERADTVGVDIEALVALTLAKELDGRLDSIEDELLHIEKLLWQNLYWTTLPYQDGLPKQRLSAEGLSKYWEKSNSFSMEYFERCRAPLDESDSSV